MGGGHKTEKRDKQDSFSNCTVGFVRVHRAWFSYYT